MRASLAVQEFSGEGRQAGDPGTALLAETSGVRHRQGLRDLDRFQRAQVMCPSTAIAFLAATYRSTADGHAVVDLHQPSSAIAHARSQLAFLKRLQRMRPQAREARASCGSRRLSREKPAGLTGAESRGSLLEACVAGAASHAGEGQRGSSARRGRGRRPCGVPAGVLSSHCRAARGGRCQVPVPLA